MLNKRFSMSAALYTLITLLFAVLLASQSYALDFDTSQGSENQGATNSDTDVVDILGQPISGNVGDASEIIAGETGML